MNDSTNRTSVLLRWTETYLKILMTAVAPHASNVAGDVKPNLNEYADWLKKCGFDVGNAASSVC